MATTPDFTLERGLPANLDAERSILGAILLDNLAFNEAAEKIRAEDFSLDSHRRIYTRMAELIDARPRRRHRYALRRAGSPKGS